ncbi:hypothetical protein [Nocardia ignorata]|uniref:DUF1449 family protein n=1 Tax=Nocardia ignorata TaxID=145285 RepID=A0A4R6PKW2_NOCIG|nr:hypothetical protein [Nocardia ignorata]TDP38400.1 hypothetical protein DFR75_10354 [Nocardia ignorata]
MGEFFTAILTFPTALFTFALLVVIAFWLLVLVGGTETELLDGSESSFATTGFDSLRLGGVPVTVAVTGLVTLSWFTSLVAMVGVGAVGLSGTAAVLAGFPVLIVAVVTAIAGTRLVVIPLRRFFRDSAQPTRQDFIGRVCVVRTGHVDTGFGQAELTSADGSSAIIQVRQSAVHARTAPLSQGDSAVVFEYDPATDTFWVAALEGN